MEPTTKGTGSKWIMAVVAIIVILLIVMVASKKKTEAPVEESERSTVSGESMDRTALEAEVGSAMNFNNESSMREVDKEFQ